MAVSPVRALLISHAQAGLNRSIREMGRNRLWAVALVAGSVGLLALLPVTMGMGFAGWTLGRAIREAWAPALIGAVFTFTAFGGGIFGGILGGSKSLDWERLRSFPLRRGQLFAAELVAGLGDLFAMMVAAGLGSFTLGLVIAQPLRAPVALLLLLASLVVMLATQLIIGGLAATLLRHLKTALFLLLGLVWISSVAVSAMGPQRHGMDKAPQIQAQALDEARMKAIGEALRRAAEALPATQSAHGLADSAALSAARQLPLLGLAALLAWIASGLLWRESRKDAQTLAVSAGQARLWTFSRPAHGLARLQWRTLMGSMIGRFAFLIPILAIAIIKGPLSAAMGQAAWAIPGAFIYLAFAASQLLFNIFGLDQGAVKGLLLLPVPPKELLYGKSLGYAFFLSLQGLMLAGLMAFFSAPGQATQIPAGLMLFAACLLAMAAVGLWTSVAMPRPLSRKKLNNTGMPLAAILIYMGTSLGCAAFFGGLFALFSWAAPAWLLPGMALAAGAMLVVFRAALELAAIYLAKHRERLVERLG